MADRFDPCLTTITQSVRITGRRHGGEADLSTAARLLKERTAEYHDRVEARLDLADPALDLTRLKAVLEHFVGFWASTEPVIDHWADVNPACAQALRWPRRRRTEHLSRDLSVLADHFGTSVADRPAARPVFAACDEADVLGWLYVSEGSTLGGAIIDRMVRPLTERSSLTLRSFTPYDEGPGPMWRDYLVQLAAWTHDDPDRTERVVAAGVRTFAALDEWLAPLRRECAA